MDHNLGERRDAYSSTDPEDEVGPSALGAISKAARVLAQIRSAPYLCTSAFNRRPD